jgi:hypothetical protein
MYIESGGILLYRAILVYSGIVILGIAAIVMPAIVVLMIWIDRGVTFRIAAPTIAFVSVLWALKSVLSAPANAVSRQAIGWPRAVLILTIVAAVVVAGLYVFSRHSL